MGCGDGACSVEEFSEGVPLNLELPYTPGFGPCEGLYCEQDVSRR